jgi:hypothetical protein
METEHEYMTEAETAELLRRSRNLLARWRMKRRGPPFCQPEGPGTKVLYARSAVKAWLEGGGLAREDDEDIGCGSGEAEQVPAAAV